MAYCPFQIRPNPCRLNYPAPSISVPSDVARSCFQMDDRCGDKATERRHRMGIAVVAASAGASSPVAFLRGRALRARWVLNPVAFFLFSAKSGSSSASSSRKLVLCSKPGCCLCDGLKEKLHADFTLSGPDSLQDVELQIRDITSNHEWEKAYQYEIPVLAKVLSDGTEEILPRLSPRVGVELVQKKISAAFRQ